MERVRAGDRRDVDDAARSAAELWREVARQDRELADRVERDVLADRGGELVVVARAVEQHVRARVALAVDAETDAARGRLVRLRDVTRELHERVRVAADGWEFLDLRLGDGRRQC